MSCLGVAVAVAAIVGYLALRRTVRRQAQKHARVAMNDYLQSDEFRAEIRIAADEALHSHIKDRVIVALQRGEPEGLRDQGRSELKEE